MTLIEFLRARYDDDERTYNYLNDMGEQGPYYFLLDDISVKRAILDAFEQCERDGEQAEVFGYHATGLLTAIRHLALLYANHADYQQEWRP